MTQKELIRQEIERLKNIAENNNASEYLRGQARVCRVLLSFIDSLPEESKNHGCGVEFPYFGANYPDGKCIDGYLWDMDSYEDGIYTIGGDDPCPICNTEKWLKDVLDDEIFKTRHEALEYVKMLKSKYKHKDSLPEEKPSEDLEEAAEKYSDKYCSDWAYRLEYEDAFIAGAEWQKEQKPAEWSEGDDAYLNIIVEDLKELYKKRKAAPDSILGKSQMDNISWLKSLSERFVLQPKQEWSEEEIIYWNTIKDYFFGIPLDDKLKSALDWFKSLRPQLKQEWQREQMLKDAVEGKVWEGVHGIRDIELQTEPFQKVMKGLKEGDKVKIIIVKQDDRPRD